MIKNDHIRLLGWLYVAYGVVILVGAALALLDSVASGLFSFDFVELIVGSIVGVIVTIVMVILSLPSLFVGKGLLDGQGWSRVGAMILGALSFFSFPIGTALCVYTFWVLWGKDADPYFEGYYPSHYERGH